MRNHRLYLGARMAHRRGLLAAVSQSDKPCVRRIWTARKRLARQRPLVQTTISGPGGTKRLRVPCQLRSRSLPKIALALACTASLQFSGCLGNAGRDLTPGLDKSAGRSALSIEQELARRKTERAQALSTGIDSTVKQADADDRDLAETSIEQAGWFNFRESPLRKLLQRNQESKPVAGDPFLNAPSPESPQQAGRAVLESNVREPEATSLASRQPSRPEASPDWDTLLKNAMNSVEKTDHRPVAREPATGAPDEDQWNNAFAKGPPEAADATAKPAPSDQSAGQDGLERRKQTLRVQALISEARTNARRGQLHSAYRSALLANQLVEQHGLEMDAAEHPRELAQQLSDRIWQAADSRPESDDAQANDPGHLRTAQSVNENRDGNPIEHDAVFSDSTDFSRWQPLPTITAATPAEGQREPGSDHPRSQSVSPEWPTVRPARLMPELPHAISAQPAPRKQGDSDSSRSSFSGPTVTAGPAQPRTRERQQVTPTQQRPFPSDAEGVTFAIAQSVEETDQVAAVAAKAPEFPGRATPPPLSAPELPPRNEGPLLNTQQSSPVGTDEMFAWDDRSLSPSPGASPPELGIVPLGGEWPVTETGHGSTGGAAEASPRSLQWGIATFITAVLATVIGLRLYRLRRNDEPEQVVELPAEEDRPEQTQRLRIKRAA